MRHLKWQRTGFPLLSFFLLSVATALPVQGIETAGELFVDLDAATLAVGDTTWTNAGSYTNFVADGTPIVTLDPVPAVYFDGASAFYSAESAPEGLTGFDATRSIEVWAYNPAIVGEETMVAWGQRGGPQGTNMAFNYSSDGTWGAVGHWGGPDVSWTSDGSVGAPETEQWHHLVYTFDGEAARVYSDGELWNEEDMIQWGGLDTWPGPGIAVGSQWQADGVTLNAGLRANMFISRVRIHDDVLTEAQIATNYDEERGSFTVAPVIPPPPPKPDLVGLWRFDDENDLGLDSSQSGNNLTPTAGVSFDADGVLDGSAFFDGVDGMLTSPDISADLPTGDGSYTVAAWIQPEIMGDRGIVGWGAYGSGRTVNALRTMGDNGFRHYWWGADLDASDIDVDDAGVDLDDGSWNHIAAVYDGGTRSLYLNGELLVSDLPGDNNALPQNFAVGRTCDWCGGGEFFIGRLDDVAVFNIALDADQLQEIMSGDFSAFLTPSLRGDFNGNGEIDLDDIDILTVQSASGANLEEYDLTDDGLVNEDDVTEWAKAKDIGYTWIGDANYDGEFSTGDFVKVLGVGKYEVATATAVWSEGDWNGDGVFGTGDLVKALGDGGYELGPRTDVAAVPEPSALALSLLGLAGLIGLSRRRG